MILYFSATGNSRYVANTLAKELGEQRLVDLRTNMVKNTPTLTITLSENEPLGIVFPVHSWGMPKFFADILENMHIQGYEAGKNYVYMLCTCGDDVGKLFEMWSGVMKKAGVEADAAYSIAMPNTYVLFPGFDVDNPEKRDQKLTAAPVAIHHVATQIKNRTKGDFTHHGAMAGLKSKVIHPLFIQYSTSDKGFAVDAVTCIGCGKCQQACPTGNIQLVKPNPTKEGKLMPEWQGRCLTCLACYHYCPTHAITYGTKTKGKHFYTCPL